MHCSGVRAVPEVIILSDSDEDDDSVREVCASATSSATASVSILYERPLSPSAFTEPPSISAAHRNVNSTPRSTCGININGASIHPSRLQSSKVSRFVHFALFCAIRRCICFTSVVALLDEKDICLLLTSYVSMRKT